VINLTVLTSTTAAIALVWALPAAAAAQPQTDPAAAPAPQTDPNAHAAADQSANDQAIGDIVVTARRRSESLQAVPIAITAVPAAKLERSGITNIQDLTKLAPSLVFDKGFAPQDNRVMMRGLPAGKGRPPVGILIDGIDTTTESIATAGGGNLMNLRLVDFERIEVVEGPQSALYGRSAFGGAINYITKEPGSKFGGYVSADVGLHGREELRGALDLPASETLSFRLNGVFSNYDGYYRNSVTGNKLGGYKTWGGALAFKWQPGSRFKLVGRVSYADDHEDQLAAKYYGANDGLATPLALPVSAAGQTVGGAKLPASILAYRPGNIENENVPIALSADPSDPTGKSDYDGAHTYNLISSLRAEWDLGGVKLSSWTGYVHSTGSTSQDIDYFGRKLTAVTRPAPGGNGEYSGTALGNGMWQFDIHTKIVQFSQEVRLAQQDGGPFRWAVGGLYWYEKVDQDDRRFLSYGLGAGASTWLNVSLQGGRSNIAATQGRTTRHWSGYALAEYDILPKLTLSVEGRYATETLDYVFGPSVGIASGRDLSLGPAPFTFVGPSSVASSTTHYFTPRGILTYKPTSDLMFYGSASRGVKPGGFTQVGSADPNLGKYAPERLSNYEIGAKTTLFNRRLRLNVALFHMDYTNKQTATLLQVPLSVNPQGALSVTTNAGGAKIDGQEIDFSAILTPDLVLSGSYTHLAPRYTDYVYNSTTPLTIARAGNCKIITVGSTTTCQITETGMDLENAPRHSAQASLTYSKSLGGDVKGFIEGSGQYRSKRNQDDSGAYILKAYALFDLKIGVETPTWSVTAYVDNLFDDRTIKTGINLLDVAAGVPGNLNMIAYAPDPRTAGLRVKYNF